MKAYRTTKGGIRIEPVEALRIEGNVIVFMYKGTHPKPIERRARIVSMGERYHRTFEEAKTHLLDKINRQIKTSQTKLAGANKDLAIVEKLRDPS